MATKIINNTFALLDSDSEEENTITSTIISWADRYISALKTHRYALWSDFFAEIYPCSCDPALSLEDNNTWSCYHGLWHMVDSYPFNAPNHTGSQCTGNCSIHPLVNDLYLRFALDEVLGRSWGDTSQDIENERLAGLTEAQRRAEAAEEARMAALKKLKDEENARAYQEILKEREEQQRARDQAKVEERSTGRPPVHPSFSTRGWGSSPSSSNTSSPSSSRPSSSVGHRAPQVSNRVPGKLYLPGIAPYNGLPRTCQYAEEPATYDAKKGIHYEAGCIYHKRGECKMFHLDELSSADWAPAKKATQEYLKARDQFRNNQNH